MKTILKTNITVAEICDGFVYNELEGKGLFGMSGRLVIQPEYQRNYIYAADKKEAGVIESLIKGYPIGLLYLVRTADGHLEVLDGQQRITSIGRFLTGKFSVMDKNGKPHYFDGIAENLREKILATKLLIYECEGEEDEIKEWFKTINIAGIPLNEQELLNAIYSGTFVTAAKAEFSNSQSTDAHKWSVYIRGTARRQDFLACALDWVSDGNTSDYMSRHRQDTGITELQNYFNSVIDWVSGVFTDDEKEMCGLEWGRLYRTYHKTPFNPAEVSATVRRLYGDSYVKDRRGIFEYILGGCEDTKLLNVRVFDEATKKSVYAAQSKAAEAAGESNCPLCALGPAANKSKMWALKDMDADHITAWSKGGTTDSKNCQLLCKTHNRAKGNR